MAGTSCANRSVARPESRPAKTKVPTAIRNRILIINMVLFHNLHKPIIGETRCHRDSLWVPEPAGRPRDTRTTGQPSVQPHAGDRPGCEGLSRPHPREPSGFTVRE